MKVGVLTLMQREFKSPVFSKLDFAGIIKLNKAEKAKTDFGKMNQRLVKFLDQSKLCIKTLRDKRENLRAVLILGEEIGYIGKSGVFFNKHC